jgi:multidrug resistance efflux pump
MASVDDLRIDAPPPRPRHRGPSLTPWLLLAGLALFVWWMAGRPMPAGLSAFQLGNPAGGKTTVVTPPADGAGTPDTAMAAPAPAGSFSAGGYVEIVPPGPVAVSSLVAAKVDRLHVIPGDKVQRGQLVAELDSSLLVRQADVLRAQVQMAESQLALTKAGFRGEEVVEAQAGVDSAQARLDRARADADRTARLYEAGVVPRAQHDAAQSELGQAQAELASARSLLDLKRSGARREEIRIDESGLRVARAELARVAFEIAQCQLRSPVSGVVYDVHAAEGAWVDPQDNSDHPGAVLSVFNPRALQAYADVSQRDSARVSVGQPVEVVTDAYPQETLSGEVERLMPQASLQKNTVRAIIRFYAVPEFLKPEMNVKVTFLVPVGADGVRPNSAVPDQGQPPAAPTEATP